MDGRVSDLVWGWAMDGKVERQSVVYYRLSVDTRQIENGFVIACKSTNKGKFKILLFNSAGVVVHQEESKELKSKEKFPVQASLYYTKFDTYQLGEPSSATVPTDKDIPPILQRLELLTPSKKTLAAGKYLICIYGDNFIGRTNFNLIAVPAKNDAPEVILVCYFEKI